MILIMGCNHMVKKPVTNNVVEGGQRERQRQRQTEREREREREREKAYVIPVQIFHFTIIVANLEA